MAAAAPALAVEVQFVARASLGAVPRGAAALGGRRPLRGGRAMPARGVGWPRAARRACIRVVGPAGSRRLNRDYRGKDKPTNVLSFPASPVERELGGDARRPRDLRARGRPRGAEQGKAGRGALGAHGRARRSCTCTATTTNGRARRAAMERLEVEILRGFGYQNPYLPVIQSTP